MPSIINLLLIAIFCLASLASPEARADGGCPPGQVPQQGQGWQSCVPLPANGQGTANNSSDTPAWTNSWQALASDDLKGILGSAVGKISRLTAESAAIEDCKSKGGTECQVKMSHGNGCIAMAVGAKAYQIQNSATQNKAEKAAMDKCTAHDTSCTIYYSECSLAVEQ